MSSQISDISYQRSGGLEKRLKSSKLKVETEGKGKDNAETQRSQRLAEKSNPRPAANREIHPA
jgi:hypothetical protein